MGLLSRSTAAHACEPRLGQGAIDAAFVDRADIKEYIGPPGLGARCATATATAHRLPPPATRHRSAPCPHPMPYLLTLCPTGTYALPPNTVPHRYLWPYLLTLCLTGTIS